MVDEYFSRETKMLNAMSATAKKYLRLATEDVRENMRVEATYLIRRRLIQNAEIAMRDHPEYSYQPLQDHLLRNLEKLGHVVVNEDLTIETVFNEDLAGTVADFEESKYPHMSDDKTRSLMWKYGIYMPAMEGGLGFQWTKSGDVTLIADYHAIIRSRLASWGDRAPYWHFLEHGNYQYAADYPKPYPVFGPTHFIHNTRVAAPDILEQVIRDQTEIFEDGVEGGLGDVLLEEQEVSVRVFVVPLGERGVSKEWWRSTRGKAFPKLRGPSGRWTTQEKLDAGLD